MKISYLSTFYPFRGGIAQFNALLLKELAKNSMTKAFTFKRQYPQVLFPGKSQMVQPNDKAEVVDSLRCLDTIDPLSYYQTAKIISLFNPELNIMKFWMPFLAPSLGKVARKLSKINCKNVAILDNVIPHEKRIGDITLTKYFLNSCDGFVVMSQTVKNDLLSLKPNAKYIELEHPIYNQFEAKISREEALIRLNLSPDKKYLLFFGFIRKYKGLDILIEALKHLPNDIELIVAGEVYGSFEDYQMAIDNNRVADRVHLFNNYIGDNEVHLYFSAADVCVLPYRSATQSGITSIAYNFDMPLIATNTGSLSEVITPYNSGIMVEEITPIAITEAVKEFYNNDITQYKTGIQSFKDKANWEYFARGILKLYKEL